MVLHRSVDRPTVLVTEGYGVSTEPVGLSEPADLLAGNQIAVEHRFFGPSRPSSPNWARQLKPIAHDAGAMPDVDRWVRRRSHRMLFVYGGNDPWSAEPFSCGADAAERGCHRYVVARGTHGARVADLPAGQRRAAVTRLERWAGLRQEPGPTPPPCPAGPSPVTACEPVARPD